MSERKNLSESQNQTELEKIDLISILSDFLYGIRKLWLLMVILIVGCSAYSYFSTKVSYTPEYVASATMSVTTPGGGGGYIDADTAKQMSEVFPYILTSGALQEVVAQELGMNSVPGNISVSAEDGTNLITISVTSGDAQMAYDVLQQVIKSYPEVAKFVIGETQLKILDETGVPSDTRKEVVIRGSYKRGALKGAVIAFVILCLYVLAKQNVKSKEKLKRYLNLQDLGSIPFIRQKKRKKKKEQGLSLLDARIPIQYTEAIRKLRIRVLNEMEKKNLKTLLITSSVPGEGKTTVSVNLALSLAKQGKRVILVDCDPRNPSVAKLLGDKEEHPGLAAVLSGDVSVQEALTEVDMEEEKLDVLFGGSKKKAKASMLGKKEMKNLLEELKSQADIVILDTAPAELLADASMLARHVDAALYVVRYNYTKMAKIRAGIQTLTMSRTNLLGYVFNGDLSEKGKRYGYGYGGYYGYRRYGYYGYGYGYGAHKNGKKGDKSGRVIKE